MKTLRQTLADHGHDIQKPTALRVGRPGHRIAVDGGVITLSKQDYPAAGARAEVSDFRSGLAGRKHTTDLTVTLPSGEVLIWHETNTGTSARLVHNQATRFAAAVNSAR
jgi:hypothetical protein